MSGLSPNPANFLSSGVWTYPVELSGDYIGYLVTPEAEAAIGYESLNSWVSRIGPDGVKQMIDSGKTLMNDLWKER